jgi:hypothetical protein
MYSAANEVSLSVSPVLVLCECCMRVCVPLQETGFLVTDAPHEGRVCVCARPEWGLCWPTQAKARDTHMRPGARKLVSIVHRVLSLMEQL